MQNQGETIRNAAEAILKERGRPIATVELAMLIRERVADELNVSRKSVYNYLYDAPQRFVRPAPGVWSIRNS